MVDRGRERRTGGGRLLGRGPSTLLALLLLAAAGAGAAERPPIRILFDSDNRGAGLSGGRSATQGLGVRSLAVKQRERREHPDLILLSAGNALGPSPSSVEDGGRVQIRLMNRAGFDAMSVGRKALFQGLENFLLRAGEARFPVLATNVVVRDEGLLRRTRPRLEQVVNLERPGGRVRVLGVVSAEALDSEPVSDPRLVVRPLIESLRAYGLGPPEPDYRVLLANLGFDETSALMEQLPWIDLVLCNRTPEDRAVRRSGLEYRLRDGRRIVWADEGGQEMAGVEMRRRDGKLSVAVELVEVPEEVPSSDRVEPSLEVLARRVARGGREVLAALSPEERRAFPAAMAEALRSEMRAEVGAVLEASVVERPPERLTRRALREAYPWSTWVARVEVTGNELAGMWRRRVNPEDPERNLHFVGIEEVRGRLLVNGRRLEGDERYRLACESFVALGGWGLLDPDREVARGPRLFEALARFFSEPGDRMARARARARRPIVHTRLDLDFTASRLGFGGSADQLQFSESTRYGKYSSVPGLVGLAYSQVTYDLGAELRIDRPDSDWTARLEASFSRYNDYDYTDRLHALLRWEEKDPSPEHPTWFAALDLRGTVTSPRVAGRRRALFEKVMAGRRWSLPRMGKLLVGGAYLVRAADPGDPESWGVNLGHEYQRDLGTRLEFTSRLDAFVAADETDVLVGNWTAELEAPLGSRLSTVLRYTHFRFREAAVSPSATRNESYVGLRWGTRSRRY